ncbi:DMT family transporter [Streptomyces sp. NRRL F-4489]|uniref:DMT family transporter n=1 Tax=Streptomyces sp. NRRL F-4489 TaxID=1609095 RepID=UPI00099E901B|nr:DMT family transporter [Streptomyces sp. NRRL F-4489]
MTADGGNRLGGIAPVLAAAVLWGTVGPAQLLADTGVSPVSLGACRMLLGGLVLGLCTARPAGLRSLLRPRARGWLVVGVLVTAAFQVCFLEAVQRTGAALATAVTFGSVPVVSGLCARWFGGEPMTAKWWGGTVCSVAGIALLLVPAGAAHADVPGVLLGTVAGAAFGLYITATRRLARHGADPRAAAPVSVLGAGLLVSPWLLVAPGGLAAPRALLLIGWLALGTTALGYLLFTRGVTRISAATTGTLSLAEPLVATLLGIALLGERPTAVAACGAALLLGGLVVVSLPAGRGPRYRPSPSSAAGSPARSRITASTASGSSGVRNGRT